jgi:hypothetical protein
VTQAGPAAVRPRRERRRVRPRPGDVPEGTVVTHVRYRTSALIQVVVGAVATLSLGGRGGGLLAMALAHGTSSPQARALYLYVTVVWVWVGLSLARSRTDLRARPGDAPLLTCTGAFHSRRIDLSGVREVVMVSMAVPLSTTGTARAFALDADGRFVRRLPGAGTLWRREDVGLLLADAGIVARYDHRTDTARAVESAYPGATLWIDRHPVWFGLLVTATILPVIGIVMDSLS